jgi:hypothetical protein
MIPLALKLEPGAESRAPMAVVVIGGMLFSTVLTLVVVPALYTLFDDLQARFRPYGAQPRAAREAAREPRVEAPAIPPRAVPIPVVADGYPDGYPASPAGVEAGG